MVSKNIIKRVNEGVSPIFTVEEIIKHLSVLANYNEAKPKFDSLFTQKYDNAKYVYDNFETILYSMGPHISPGNKTLYAFFSAIQNKNNPNLNKIFISALSNSVNTLIKFINFSNIGIYELSSIEKIDGYEKLFLNNLDTFIENIYWPHSSIKTFFEDYIYSYINTLPEEQRKESIQKIIYPIIPKLQDMLLKYNLEDESLRERDFKYILSMIIQNSDGSFILDNASTIIENSKSKLDTYQIIADSLPVDKDKLNDILEKHIDEILEDMVDKSDLKDINPDCLIILKKIVEELLHNENLRLSDIRYIDRRKLLSCI